MKLKIIITLFVVICAKCVMSQNVLHSLTVGDHLPEFIIPKIFQSKRIIRNNTKHYKSKLLIIDFWGTSCVSCVEGLPRLDSLQNRFGDKIKILPVTTEKEDKVKSFWNNNKYTKKLFLSSVVEDKLFSTYFKYIYLGLKVWVYKGKVIGMTSSDYVDEYNIKRVLRGDQIKWPVVNDFLKMDMTTPLFTLDPRQVDTNSVVQYSIISGSRENVNSFAGIFRNQRKKTIRTFAVNSPILSLYFSNWTNLIPIDSLVKPFTELQPNQIIWEVKDKYRYTFVNKEGDYLSSWKVRNAICFESLVIDTGQNNSEISSSIIKDIDRLMGLHVRWEKKNRKVWIVTKGKSYNSKISKTVVGTEYNIYNFIYTLNQIPNNPYIFNETGVENDTKIKFDIRFFGDFTKIKEALRSYGFNMEEKERAVDMLVFTEIDNQPRFPVEHNNK